MKIINELGKAFENENLKIMHMMLKTGEKITPHNHPGYMIFFNVFNGNIDVKINDYINNLKGGDILNFDGENTISANAITDTEVYVYLLKKEWFYGNDW